MGHSDRLGPETRWVLAILSGLPKAKCSDPKGQLSAKPRIDELLDSLNMGKYFTSVDLQSGYWQIHMDEDARAKTAFTGHLGLYQFREMPLGLTDAPATFHRLMDCVLTGLSGLVCLVFLDDVIIYTKLSIEQP